MNKQEIRKEMQARRRAMTAEERAKASAGVCEKLAGDNGVLNLADLAAANSIVAVYMALPLEIDLSAFIGKLFNAGIRVVAPRWDGNMYDLAVLEGLDDVHLREGPMGVMEPAEANLVPPQKVDVWIIPGLAFTKDGARLGYGGGWYDRFLSAAPCSARKIGVAYSFQVVPSLPTESHDIKLSDIVSLV